MINLLQDYDVNNKVILLRVDFNVPIINGAIQDLTRVLRVIPTINYLVGSNAKTVIISHFGRPKGRNDSLSLQQVIESLSKLLNRQVSFVDDCIGDKVNTAIKLMMPGDVILLENLRFYPEEELNDIDFAKKLSSVADIYVNDAFSCSHRNHASIAQVAKFLPAYVGFCLQDEVNHLEEIISCKYKPTVAIVGGAKISTKINLLLSLAQKVEFLILGGAIANNFLLAQNFDIGKSLYEKDTENISLEVMKVAAQNNCKIILPQDILVAKDANYKLGLVRGDLSSILDNDVILDIGPKTLDEIRQILLSCKAVLWNGPLGAFEYPAFSNGTFQVAREIASLTQTKGIKSIVGGGDSLSAINAAGVNIEDFTYVSTGGGAFLQYISGNEMPGLSSFICL
ncbi:MAG: phosphoglycerate kinase [Candidatus Mesenet longicola]|uniref:Phosphoglycerate kinase n=1 Tax=Candidatus Mesenet longicola TaxID=1892558 RepID=A0A8J3HUR1_9RICK|nr:MAG: phosphoglycerate kinase [Candidatus Mesenet longicola]GHM59275.1 MAG: phosphoglycerate kinase [Candidatus Mesenet longicola]